MSSGACQEDEGEEEEEAEAADRDKKKTKTYFPGGLRENTDTSPFSFFPYPLLRPLLSDEG